MFSIITIDLGRFLADGGATFGAIPKRAWKRKYPEVGDNLCMMSMRCLLAVSDDRKILVDLGMGDKYLNRVSYYQPSDLRDISEELRKYNVRTEEITDVILTHLHFDHCGYATQQNGTGQIIPTFQNARYWLSRAQWDNLNNPNLLESDSLFLDNILPVFESGQLNLVDEDTHLCNDLEIRLYHGHTVGQLLPFIFTDEGVVTFPGDLIPTSAHVPLEWISAYDLCAQTSVKEKKRFLDEAEKEGYTLIYYHDAYVQRSKVKKLNNNFKAHILD